MDLNHKTFGQGHPLVILHGLFGTLDNWQTLGKQWADEYMVYLVDQRNHGRSPHLPEMSYPAMASDLREFLENNWIHSTYLLGHSMGGKTAMQTALQFPDLVEKLVVVDIAPKAYPGGHQAIFEALFDLDLSRIEDRSEADEQLSRQISDKGVRQFLLKNLTRTKDGAYRWKMNLEVIQEHYPEILAGIESQHPFEGPTLFVRGAKSDYVADSDMEKIQTLFPNARLETVSNAGHWVHAEQPDALYKLVSDFLAE